MINSESEGRSNSEPSRISDRGHKISINDKPGNRINSEPGSRISSEPGSRINSESVSRISSEPGHKIKSEQSDRIRGERTFEFVNKPFITGAASVAGELEGKGPQAKWFDILLKDDMYGEKTWEKAESKMLKDAVCSALAQSGRNKSDIDVLLCGDLINQIMSSSFMARDLKIPFLGLYGACSTMTQSMLIGSSLVDAGFCRNVIAGASSHFSTAERQFRMPLEHGNQRPPTSQWTATAAGAVIISSDDRMNDRKICVTHATVGRIIDPGLKDVNQMGAAMAPAAVDTILQHLRDLRRTPEEYDLILTGDLGDVGRKVVVDQIENHHGMKMKEYYDDCGSMMYGTEEDPHAGGSGCGCSASIISGRIIKQLRSGDIKRAMLISTGALLSTISAQQGESIPGIAHAISVESV